MCVLKLKYLDSCEKSVCAMNERSNLKLFKYLRYARLDYLQYIIPSIINMGGNI